LYSWTSCWIGAKNELRKRTNAVSSPTLRLPPSTIRPPMSSTSACPPYPSISVPEL
jgi:hypothetical protein